MTPLDQKICSLASPGITVSEVAALADCNRTHVYKCIERYQLVLKQRKKPAQRSTLKPLVLSLSDGVKTSSEIARLAGCSEKYVQNILRNQNADRLPRGARSGRLNHSYRYGRTIDLDGYALVLAPSDHPNARKDWLILEHRLVLEKKLGRYLLPEEVVDHIDGLHLHNDPENLRVFATNADHLRETISGMRPNWSQEGIEKMRIPSHLRKGAPQVDSYRLRKERGDVRLLQILLAASRLGINSPHLLGTLHHLEKAQIDYSQQTTIERALDALYPESSWDQTR